MRLYFSVPYGILKYSKPLPVIYFVVSGLKIILMIALINTLSLYGVIVASLVSALVENILLRSNLKNMFQFQFNVFKIVLAPLILMAMIVIMEPLFGTEYPMATHAFYLVCCGALLAWGYRNEIQLMNPFRSS